MLACADDDDIDTDVDVDAAAKRHGDEEQAQLVQAEEAVEQHDHQGPPDLLSPGGCRRVPVLVRTPPLQRRRRQGAPPSRKHRRPHRPGDAELQERLLVLGGVRCDVPHVLVDAHAAREAGPSVPEIQPEERGSAGQAAAEQEGGSLRLLPAGGLTLNYAPWFDNSRDIGT